ncbi:MAG: peptide-N-glycosidase F-related protein [Deltaproteobacteria bacterium]|nr:peptide-N-glycosidase F-related protein [Deltaproteobacteria bacterium]
MTSSRQALLFLALSASLVACPSPEGGEPDAGPVDAGDACLARCTSMEDCPEVDDARCVFGCEDATVRACLLDATGCGVGAECLVDVRLPPVRPFQAGPYSNDYLGLAGPSVLPTLRGEWDLEKEWTGADHHLFSLYAAGVAYTEQVWASDVAAFLAATPRNVHLYFLAYVDRDQVDRSFDHVSAQRNRVEVALAGLPTEEALYWRARIHYVTRAANNLGGWLGPTIRTHGPAALAIDARQRFRQVGLLAPVQGPAQLRFLANEARYYEWEEQLAAGLPPADLEIVFADEVETTGEHRATVTLPDAATMRSFDALDLDLVLACPGHDDNNCGEWDYLAHVQLCETADGACPTQLGRFITPYHREGRWVVDATWALALLGDGGEKHLRFTAPVQPNGTSYLISVTLRLRDTGSATRPASLLPLFTGGTFDENYVANHPPISHELATLPPRAELVMLLTGHGFGDDLANCAEFCNHTHDFGVNGGGEFHVDHPWVGDPEGCMKQVEVGVVPNQYGTWPLGRGGWCPGLEVAPHVFDVTSRLQVGANVFSYDAGLDGQPYVPQPAPDPTNFPGRIDLQSFLVLYETK